MKTKFAACCVVIGTALGGTIAQAADRDAICKPLITPVEDSAITARIKARLTEAKISSLATISIDTDAAGEVFLCGKVVSEQEADRITYIVRKVEGVKAAKSTFWIPSDK